MQHPAQPTKVINNEHSFRAQRLVAEAFSREDRRNYIVHCGNTQHNSGIQTPSTSPGRSSPPVSSSDEDWESFMSENASAGEQLGVRKQSLEPQQFIGACGSADKDAVMHDHDPQRDGSEPHKAIKTELQHGTEYSEHHSDKRSRSRERRYDTACTSPSANAAVDKLSRVHLGDASDNEQVHSPRSSAASQRKRSRTSSPSCQNAKQRTLAGGSERPSSRYVNAEGAQVALVSKRRLRTVSALKAAGTAPKPRRKSFVSKSAPRLPPVHAAKLSPTHQVKTTFTPTYDKLGSCRVEAGQPPFLQDVQASWNPQVRSHAYANVPQMMPFGYGVANINMPRYDMVLQPKSSPLTQQQLGAEIKGIYAGLVMVEAKCITLDNARAADPTSVVSREDWQTLIALHRTLLYEHHDFLMATQHPSANPALRGLASKYCMPARMWKHGIHAFLEVLRHRRPQSQEYMLTFIYLAYQMMCLLYDTIPSYLDTWIECLGDLARYRMAIEEDKEVHAVWCSVAGRWYQMAADRHPRVGRLYHHLGILERPSLRKLYFYARSLTSFIPFLNAAESLATLCAPILQDDKAIRHSSHSAEAVTICFHARVFTCQNRSATAKDAAISQQDLDVIARDGIDAHSLLKEQPSVKIAMYGVALAVTNIAALFQYGLQQNIFRVMYTEALARDARSARPTVQAQAQAQDLDLMNLPGMDVSSDQQTTYPLEAVVTFWASCFNDLIDGELPQTRLRDLMQYVHVNLVWFSSLINVRERLQNPAHVQVIDELFDRIHWDKLADFINAISQIDPITQRVEEHAILNIFLMPDLPCERHPLVEDYMLRGIVWAENYPSPDLFIGIEDDDGSRAIETPARLHLRAERVLWLACLVAQPAKRSGLQYDRMTQKFSARSASGVESTYEQSTQPSICSTSPMSVGALRPSSSPASTADGFEMVRQPLDVQSLSSMEESGMATAGRSYVSSTASLTSPKKRPALGVAVRIEGETNVDT